MLYETVNRQLETLHQEVEQEIAQLDEMLALYSDEYRAVTEKIEKLYTEREELVAQKNEDQRKRAYLVSFRREQQFKIIYDSLHAAHAQLLLPHTDMSALEKLQSERKRLLEADPTLASTLQEVEAFEQSGKAALNQLSESYRQVLLDAHRRNRQQIAPLLEIQRQLAELECSPLTTVELLLFMVVEPERERVHWLTPWRITQAEAATIDTDATPLLIATNNAFLSLVDAEHWQVHDLERSIWSEFLAFDAEANYTGPLPLQQAVEMSLTRYLEPLEAKIHCKVTIKVLPLAQEIWQLLPSYTLAECGTLPTAPTIEGSSVEQPEPITSEVSMPEAPIAELTAENGWFTQQDLVAWNRTLKTGKQSQWSKQARRMRTLLMRLLAHGKVNGEAVAFDALVKGLPEPHFSEVCKGLDRLRQSGILRLVEPERMTKEAMGVTLVAEYLEDIQSLINRQITPLWEQILA